jgi:hypothetical protein
LKTKDKELFRTGFEQLQQRLMGAVKKQQLRAFWSELLLFCDFSHRPQHRMPAFCAVGGGALRSF